MAAGVPAATVDEEDWSSSAFGSAVPPASSVPAATADEEEDWGGLATAAAPAVTAPAASGAPMAASVPAATADEEDWGSSAFGRADDTAVRLPAATADEDEDWGGLATAAAPAVTAPAASGAPTAASVPAAPADEEDWGSSAFGSAAPMAAGVPAATADEEEDWGSSAFGGAAVSELPNSDVADWGAFDEGGFESNAGAGADWGSFDEAPAVAGVAANDGQLATMVPASDVEQLVQVSRACLFGQPSLLTSRCSRLGNQHSSLCAGSLQWSGGGARTASSGACGVCVPHTDNRGPCAFRCTQPHRASPDTTQPAPDEWTGVHIGIGQ